MNKQIKALHRLVRVNNLDGIEGIQYGFSNNYNAKDAKKDLELVEQALNEIEDLRHNYKAINLMLEQASANYIKMYGELKEKYQGAIERDKAMKIKYIQTPSGGALYQCPRCNQILDNPNKYCDECGGKLVEIDWSKV